MRTEEILNYYWDIFLSHLCEFYPLDKDFIATYAYELDWKSISKNQGIQWDINFLEIYESRFNWNELAWNPAIVWDEEKIDRFKKRLDWYYLGRNKSLPLSEEFIVKYAKKLTVVEDHPLLTASLIEKHKLKIVPKNNHDTQDLKEYQESDFDTIFKTYTFYHNQLVMYEKLFFPIIRERSLEKIFEHKFNYSQRYYFLEPLQVDIHGLTPEFEIRGSNPFKVFREGRDLFMIPEKLTVVNGSLQEGPDRLYEIPRFSSFSYYTTMLVSENVKKVLEQFKLPKHIFHPVHLEPKKLQTATHFYILQVSFDTLNKDLNYHDKSFTFSFKDFDNRGHGIVEDEIESYDDMVAVAEKLKKIHSPNGYGVTLLPDKYEINTDCDLYSYSVHGKMIINHYLKNQLEKNFPGQLLFTSAQLLNIQIDQNTYDEKKKLSINTKLSSKLSYRESEEDQFYFKKMERLEQSDPPIELSIADQDKFSKKEVELKVKFPEIFKNNFLNKKVKVKGYYLLPISKFYLKNEYANRYPETYKSVVIAENGSGDSIHLLLERDDDHQLQNKLFEFFHETGEYEEI